MAIRDMEEILLECKLLKTHNPDETKSEEDYESNLAPLRRSPRIRQRKAQRSLSDNSTSSE